MNKPAGSALSDAIAGRFDGIEQGVAFGWALAPRELQRKLGIELLDGSTVVAAGGCATRQANVIEALWILADDEWQREAEQAMAGPIVLRFSRIWLRLPELTTLSATWQIMERGHDKFDTDIQPAIQSGRNPAGGPGRTARRLALAA